MDANTAASLLARLFSARAAEAIAAWQDAWALGSFGIFWDFWALLIPFITYLYTQSERSTFVVLLTITALGYTYGLLSLSLPILTVGAALLMAKILHDVIAQVRS